MPETEGVLHWTDVLLRLLAATLAGAVIGFNREITQKPAGLRTHALVSLGSALVVVTAVLLGPSDGRVHPDATARVIQGIVAGIGFIGGGVILHAEGRHVLGLTTAATIWVAAALGVTCGVGHWAIAGTAVGITLFVLVVGQWVEKWIGTFRQPPDTSNAEPPPDGQRGAPT
ncbi:MAG TPA: MgtC/SapB family protein [Gemmatimonadaceae bacterium]|nr:MgtC/SapB family protein [Gemmatimonadaceae bacterium]